jgi:hypothetical protein
MHGTERTAAELLDMKPEEDLREKVLMKLQRRMSSRDNTGGCDDVCAAESI